MKKELNYSLSATFTRTFATMSPSPKPARTGRTLFRVLIVIAVAFCAFLFLVLIAYATGFRHGEEFSPDDFSRRTFDFIRPSWFPVTLLGIDYSTISDPLTTSLVSSGYITPTNANPQKWDLVSDNVMPDDSTAYDARILCRYFGLRKPDGTLLLDDWNDKHDKDGHPKILWPAVATLARTGRYVDVPRLMDLVLAEPDIDVATFQKKVDQIMSEIFPEGVPATINSAPPAQPSESSGESNSSDNSKDVP